LSGPGFLPSRRAWRLRQQKRLVGVLLTALLAPDQEPEKHIRVLPFTFHDLVLMAFFGTANEETVIAGHPNFREEMVLADSIEHDAHITFWLIFAGQQGMTLTLTIEVSLVPRIVAHAMVWCS
jgi:hypothetical protein